MKVGVEVTVPVLVGVPVKDPPFPWRRSDWETDTGPVRERLEVGEGVGDAREGRPKESSPTNG